MSTKVSRKFYIFIILQGICTVHLWKLWRTYILVPFCSNFHIFNCFFYLISGISHPYSPYFIPISQVTNEANYQHQYKMVSKKGVSKEEVLGFIQLVANANVNYQAVIDIIYVASRIDRYFVFMCGFQWSQTYLFKLNIMMSKMLQISTGNNNG